MKQKRTRIDLKPPKDVQAACKNGLELQPEHGGHGLVKETLTWAHKLATGRPVTAQKARKMRAWFARHKVDRRPHWDNPPTPGFVAWQLWGGDAGRHWAQRLVEAIDRPVDK